MKQFAKNILVLGVTSALSLSFLNLSQAATYEVVDKGNAENLEYTYGKKQNNQGVMAVSGTNIYNFPVQFEYFGDDDFDVVFVKTSRPSRNTIIKLEEKYSEK